jgi:hypothetical protein
MSYFIFSLVGGVLDRKGLFWTSEFRQQHEIVNGINDPLLSDPSRSPGRLAVLDTDSSELHGERLVVTCEPHLDLHQHGSLLACDPPVGAASGIRTPQAFFAGSKLRKQSLQWPTNPKKVCSNWLFKPIATVPQNKDADITPSKNQANFPCILDDRLRTESRCTSF